MWIPTISTILIVVAAALLVLGTLPMKNELKDMVSHLQGMNNTSI